MAQKTSKIRLGLVIAAVIALFAGIGLFIGLGMTGLLLSAWLVAPIALVILAVGLLVTRIFLDRPRQSTTESRVDTSDEANTQNNAGQQHSSKIQYSNLVPSSPQNPSKKTPLFAVSQKAPKPNYPNSVSYKKKGSYSTVGPVTKELLSSSETEKADWVIKDCQEILLGFGIGDKRIEFKELSSTRTDQNENYKISITIPYYIFFCLLPKNVGISQDAQKMDSTFREIGEKATQKIAEKYGPDRNCGYVGGQTNIGEKLRFESQEIFISQKAIDFRIKQEYQKEQFKDRILNIFHEAKLPPSHELNFIEDPRFQHCVKENPNLTCYEFYSIETEAANQESWSTYLNWLKDTINTNLKNDLVTLRVDRDPNSSEITLKLEARCYKVAELLEAEFKATKQQLNLF